MNLSAPFIRRPVMTALVMASFVAFGLAAYRELPVSDLPAVDFPTIQVTATLPGASPETMAAAVAMPLERQFSTIAGLAAMNSSSGQGQTQITLEFELDRDIDAAAQDVQSMIASAGFTLRNEGGEVIAGGSCRIAAAIAEFTSCAAASMLRSSENWMVIWVVPWPLCEVMESTPAMVENCFSRGVATAEAMVSGSAPGSDALT